MAYIIVRSLEVGVYTEIKYLDHLLHQSKDVQMQWGYNRSRALKLSFTDACKYLEYWKREYPFDKFHCKFTIEEAND